MRVLWCVCIGGGVQEIVSVPPSPSPFQAFSSSEAFSWTPSYSCSLLLLLLMLPIQVQFLGMIPNPPKVTSWANIDLFNKGKRRRLHWFLSFFLHSLKSHEIVTLPLLSHSYSAILFLFPLSPYLHLLWYPCIVNQNWNMSVGRQTKKGTQPTGH
jgi:hypothetical protein